MLRFVGLKEGRETVGRINEKVKRYLVPFGLYTVALSIGAAVPLWRKSPSRDHVISDLIARWPWVSRQRTVIRGERRLSRTVVRATGAPRGRFTTLKELLTHAPLEDIQLRPGVHESTRVGGLARERTIRARGIYEKVAHEWFARTPEALAYCELIQAWDRRATRHRCSLCRSIFLRPSAVFGTLCPICRRLTWRQQDKVEEHSQAQRRRLAIQLYAQHLRTPGWGYPQVAEEVQ